MNNSSLFAKQCIAESLIDLMEEKEYQNISLTEICAKSGFSRMAYYRNFKSKDDILISYMQILADQFHTSAVEKFSFTPAITQEYLKFAFSYFKQYYRFMMCLQKANLAAVLQYGLNYYMDQYHLGPDATMDSRYRMYYYAGGLCNLFTIWINRGMIETEDEMAKIVYDRFNHQY